MQELTYIPDWLGGALVGAVIAALGYVGNLLHEIWTQRQAETRGRRAKLVELQSLLRAARVSFEIQAKHRDTLDASLAGNPQTSEGLGYEKGFERAYATFTADQKELHEIIRGITIYAMKPTNQRLLKWIDNDNYFKAYNGTNRHLRDLAAKIGILQAHLLIWQAKYSAWIPDAPQHALVYMADEAEHGVGFPTGTDETVKKVLNEWR